MKIVSWNCSGALRNKTQLIDRLEADIVIVQECENPLHSTTVYRTWANDYLWYGESKNKGIGIFAKNGHRIKCLNWHNDFHISGLKSKSRSISWKTSDLKLFMPVMVNESLTILAVWTKGSEIEMFGYMGQFWKYLQLHRSELTNSNTLIVGDFNSNSIWDKPDRWWNHSDVIEELNEIGINSLYHHQFNEKQGIETMPTFFLHRNMDKAYHIDYAFVSSDLLPQCDLNIGSKSDWLSFSDHMPLIVKINN